MELFWNALRFTFTCLEVVLIFNLIIVVHEVGHFLAARWRGLKIDRFGIWFGKPIWKRNYNGVDYCLGWIPAGGYVALPQMAPMEAIEGKNGDDGQPLPPITPVDKIIVAAAGPIFSMALAFVFAFLIMFIGKPVSQGDESVVVGYVVPKMPAAEATCTTPDVPPGLKVGDKILEVDGHAVNRFSGMNDSIRWRIVRSEGQTIPFVVERDGKKLTFNSTFDREKRPFYMRGSLREVGLLPEQQPMVAKVEENSVAAKAGLRPNDIIMAVNGHTVYSQMGFTGLLGSQPEPTSTLTVRRGKELLEIPFPAIHPQIGGIIDEPNSPAVAAGLKAGDTITALNGVPTYSGDQLVQTVEAGKGAPLAVSILRDGKPMEMTVRPTQVKIDNETQPGFMIGTMLTSPNGITWDATGETTIGPANPIQEVGSAVMTMVNTLSAIISPKSDLKINQLGGPLQITRVYYLLLDSPEGWRRALWFSILLNVNLAIMNMLPLPVLDGGHITLSVIELIRRRPMSTFVMERLQSSCALLLIGFILFVSFYDVVDLTFLGGGQQTRFEFLPPDSVAR